jgi:hypothetical protein
MPLEIYQMDSFGHPTFVIVLRMKNIVAFALGKMHAWGLVTPDMTYDAWDYVHITTWNFLPFLLRRVGAAPAWVVYLTFVGWGTALAALALVACRLWWVLMPFRPILIRWWPDQSPARVAGYARFFHWPPLPR